MSDRISISAHQLAQMIRSRTISSAEVVDAIIAQIAKHNSKLNAICTLDEERARQQAIKADEALARGENWGILHGVPITIKDSFETAGIRTTSGYKLLKDYIPKEDATAVARLRAAGAIILGKTNLAKLAGYYQSTNDLFPRVNNPWNLNCTAGGSSGGSAAAVAAGLSPLDIGSDISGSIRQPAHFCGVYGLKPTDRRVSTTGHIPEVPGMPKSIRQCQTVGPLARSVEDLRLCFSLIAGADPRQSDIPPVTLDIPNQKSLQNLRILWTDELDLYPVAQSIKLTMQSVGTKIEKWVPKFDFVAAWQLYFIVIAYNMICSRPLDSGSVLESMGWIFRQATQGDRALRKLDKASTTVLSAFLKPSFQDYFAALTERDRLITQMDAELAQWDVLLCPVAMTPAFAHCPTGAAIAVDGRKIPYGLASGAYTTPFSFTGRPVVVIPVGRTEDGLPIGMQIVGKRWREMELLAIADELDKAIGNFQHPSGYY